MKIKVCGMRDPANVAQVAALGIDMMGFIFYGKSPRCVTSPVPLPQGGVEAVGVFVDEQPATVARIARECGLDVVQLHGGEPASDIDEVKRLVPRVRVIKAISVKEPGDVMRCKPYEGKADCLLFDTKCPGKGGSGVKFDWTVLNQYQGVTPFLLSGGIGPGDVDRVRAFHHPCCVGIDLNSRFEVVPGLKDVALLKRFINEIRNKK